MAEEELVEAEGKKKPKKGLPKVVIIILITLIGAVIAASVAALVAKALIVPPPPPPVEPSVTLPKLYTYKLGEFLAKLVHPEEPVYVRIENLTVAFKREYEYLPKELEERKFQLRDIVNDILIASTPEIGSLEGKKAFKEKLLYEFNRILRDGQIEEIYCELILQ